MGKDEYTIALIEGFALGHVDRSVVDAGIRDSSSYDNTKEALALYAQATEAIEIFSLRQELYKIAEENS